MARDGYGQFSFESDHERKSRRGPAHDTRVTEASGGDKPCGRGERCASATRNQGDDGTWRRVPANSYQVLCPTDRSILSDCVLAMPAAHRRLGATIGEQPVREVLRHAPFGPSVLLRTDIDLYMRLLTDTVMTWHERVAQVARLSCQPTVQWRARSLNGHAVTLLDETVPVLHAHLDALLSLQAEPMIRPACSPAAKLGDILAEHDDTVLVVAGGEVAALELMALDYAVRSVLGEIPAPVTRLLGVACKTCQRHSLVLAPPPLHESSDEYDEKADAYSVCQICGDEMSGKAYRNWCRAWARYYSAQTVTPAMMAAAN